MKVISDSSPPMLLSLLKNDPCSDNAYIFGLAKLQKKGGRRKLDEDKGRNNHLKFNSLYINADHFPITFYSAHLNLPFSTNISASNRLTIPCFMLTCKNKPAHLKPPLAKFNGNTMYCSIALFVLINQVVKFRLRKVIEPIHPDPAVQSAGNRSLFIDQVL